MAMKERAALSFSGWLALLAGLGALAAAVFVFATIKTHQHEAGKYVGMAMGLGFFGFLLLTGCAVIGPNEARVLTFFGRYTGSVREAGLRWMNPLSRKTPVSLRVRNFETAKIKVNDQHGNPIEIGAVIVWRVVDTAQATFDVESFTGFVQVQAESAMRNLAMHHPYDSHDDNAISLRGQSEAVAELLKQEVNRRSARRAARWWTRASRTWRTRRRSRRRCCSGSRRARSSRRGSASSRARCRWSRWRSSSCRRAASSSSTSSARRRWSRTCSSSCAASAPRSP
jgi:hypothetical protein